LVDRLDWNLNDTVRIWKYGYTSKKKYPDYIYQHSDKGVVSAELNPLFSGIWFVDIPVVAWQSIQKEGVGSPWFQLLSDRHHDGGILYGMLERVIKNPPHGIARTASNHPILSEVTDLLMPYAPSFKHPPSVCSVSQTIIALGDDRAIDNLPTDWAKKKIARKGKLVKKPEWKKQTRK